MKKKFAILFICFLTACVGIKAQFVSLPDTNFRNDIRIKWPAAFNAAGEMDTSFFQIVTANQLVCPGANIKDLTGIQYFKNITGLICSGNRLTNFPTQMPPLLANIFCDNNQFTNIPTLPDGIETLSIYNNNITQVNALPLGLKYLIVSNNPITIIDSLPSGLLSLTANYTKLRTLPTLPNTLEQLYCAYGVLNSMPALPNSITYINCENDSLTGLPALPNSLLELYCNNNQITSLPSLPPLLKKLYCYNNGMITLPALPNSLIVLSCGNNNLTVLPTLSNNLATLVCNSNKLTQLPAFPPLLNYLDCGANKITTLPFIPSVMSYLGASTNLLTALPTMPPTMTTLDVQNNKIITLPPLPDSLKRFYIDLNPLTSIISIPTTLIELGISYTKINSLPTLPKSLTTLSLIADSNLLCIPYLPKDLTYIATAYSGVKCLPNIPPNCSNVDNLPTCNATNNINQCQSYPQIYGLVFNDNNNNGIKDIGDASRNNIKVQLSNGAFAYTNTKGEFNITADTIGSYNVTIIKPSFYNAIPTSFVHNLSSYTTVVNDTFALKANTAKDSLTVHITPFFSRARPGFQFPYHVQYENVGTTVLSPPVKVKFDATKLILDSVSLPGAVVAGDSIVLNKSNYLQGELTSFNIYFSIKTNAAIGDSIRTTASGNAATAYSIDYAANIISGSYDPNDKLATPTLTPSQVSNGSFVDYTIRFQNTGNDTAYTVVIADTLSSLLQTNVLQMLGTSHLCKTTLYNGIVYFEFKNILLPDSGTNKLLSNGFIRFRIRPDSTVALGDIIPNKASIYFDYNTPIVTNTCQTIIKNRPLPLQLLSYKASLTKNRQVLNEWTTANEVNTAFFNVQRSSNGKDFKPVGKVNALSRWGTLSYQFTDPLKDESTQGNLYYRLEMLDKDVTKTYSPLQRVVLSNDLFVNVYPNPTNDVVTIEGKELNSISLVDNTGRMIWTKRMLNSTKEILSVKQLTKGVYFLKAVHENGETKTMKLVIE